MHRLRVIPVLLVNEGGLVKGTKFKDHKYVGDPINTVKIFNEKEVDELCFIDIAVSQNNKIPNFSLISEIAGEAFMPVSYGGGLNKISQVEKLFSIGIEKAIIGTTAYQNPNFILELANISGSQSIVVKIDVKKSLFGNYHVYINNGKTKTNVDPIIYAKRLQDLGAGEFIVTSIDREGTGTGYDIDLLNKISSEVDVPVIGLGGAGSLQDIADVKNETAVSGLGIGNLCVYHGKHNAVLITYPNYEELEKLFK